MPTDWQDLKRLIAHIVEEGKSGHIHYWGEAEIPFYSQSENKF